MKMNLGTPEGKTYTVSLEGKESAVVGKRIGDVIDGSLIGLPGYKIKLTGGSDSSGFPMRYDVEGTGKKRVLIGRGPGLRKKAVKKHKGVRLRKMVRGNTYSSEIVQVNAMVVEKEEGALPIEELLGGGEKKEGSE